MLLFLLFFRLAAERLTYAYETALRPTRVTDEIAKAQHLSLGLQSIQRWRLQRTTRRSGWWQVIGVVNITHTHTHTQIHKETLQWEKNKCILDPVATILSSVNERDSWSMAYYTHKGADNRKWATMSSFRPHLKFLDFPLTGTREKELHTTKLYTLLITHPDCEWTVMKCWDSLMQHAHCLCFLQHSCFSFSPSTKKSTTINHNQHFIRSYLS